MTIKLNNIHEYSFNIDKDDLEVELRVYVPYGYNTTNSLITNMKIYETDKLCKDFEIRYDFKDIDSRNTFLENFRILGSEELFINRTPLLNNNKDFSFKDFCYNLKTEFMKYKNLEYAWISTNIDTEEFYELYKDLNENLDKLTMRLVKYPHIYYTKDNTGEILDYIGEQLQYEDWDVSYTIKFNKETGEMIGEFPIPVDLKKEIENNKLSIYNYERFKYCFTKLEIYSGIENCEMKQKFVELSKEWYDEYARKNYNDDEENYNNIENEKIL